MLPALLTMIVTVILVYSWFHLPFYKYVILLHIDTCLAKFQRLVKNCMYKEKVAYEIYIMY